MRLASTLIKPFLFLTAVIVENIIIVAYLSRQCVLINESDQQSALRILTLCKSLPPCEMVSKNSLALNELTARIKSAAKTQSLSMAAESVVEQELPFYTNETFRKIVTAHVKLINTLRAVLPRIAKHLSTAHRYAKSSLVLVELYQAFSLVSDLMMNVFNDESNVTEHLSLETNVYQAPKENGHKQRQICPEIWMGMEYGYPLYYEGYIIDPNCTYGVPLRNLVTIVLNVHGSVRVLDVGNILSGIETFYPSIKVVIGVKESELSAIEHLKKSVNVSITPVPFLDDTPNNVWYGLLDHVTTPYVFIGRNLSGFDENSRLERLLRLIDYTNADVVGGSHRNTTGHWKVGCFQMKMRNYVLKVIEGYDLSYNSCVYCDYITGPFMGKLNVLKSVFDVKLNGELMFLDAFAKLQNKSLTTMVCPDALFYTKDLHKLEATSWSQWILFIQNWRLSTIILPNKEKLEFSCTEQQFSCTKRSGIMLPPCCLKELSDMLKFLMSLCEKYSIDCEVEAGTIIGAVKLEGTLFWERDADIDYRSESHALLATLKSEFSAAGYTLEETVGSNKNCKTSATFVNCGYFGLRSNHWRIQMYGVSRLGSDILLDKGLNFTKVLIDGQWMNAFPNPPLFGRNLYGDDLFEHVEHWLDLGFQTGWIPYVTGSSWLACPEPGAHFCLDNYLPVGNIQFQDVWI